mmetsp:Transcript_5054/g.12775  ORF Transcript_5054/g.12775 Transcript_5054/m.12775 type:complete len:602 (+) Transcript_5054:2730-4535(+)
MREQGDRRDLSLFFGIGSARGTHCALRSLQVQYSSAGAGVAQSHVPAAQEAGIIAHSEERRAGDTDSEKMGRRIPSGTPLADATAKAASAIRQHTFVQAMRTRFLCICAVATIMDTSLCLILSALTESSSLRSEALAGAAMLASSGAILVIENVAKPSATKQSRILWLDLLGLALSFGLLVSVAGLALHEAQEDEGLVRMEKKEAVLSQEDPEQEVIRLQESGRDVVGGSSSATSERAVSEHVSGVAVNGASTTSSGKDSGKEAGTATGTQTGGASEGDAESDAIFRPDRDREPPQESFVHVQETMAKEVKAARGASVVDPVGSVQPVPTQARLLRRETSGASGGVETPVKTGTEAEGPRRKEQLQEGSGTRTASSGGVRGTATAEQNQHQQHAFHQPLPPSSNGGRPGRTAVKMPHDLEVVAFFAVMGLLYSLFQLLLFFRLRDVIAYEDVTQSDAFWAEKRGLLERETQAHAQLEGPAREQRNVDEPIGPSAPSSQTTHELSVAVANRGSTPRVSAAMLGYILHVAVDVIRSGFFFVLALTALSDAAHYHEDVVLQERLLELDVRGNYYVCGCVMLTAIPVLWDICARAAALRGLKEGD